MNNVEVQTNSIYDLEVSDVNVFSHRNGPGPTDSSHVETISKDSLLRSP